MKNDMKKRFFDSLVCLSVAFATLTSGITMPIASADTTFVNEVIETSDIESEAANTAEEATFEIVSATVAQGDTIPRGTVDLSFTYSAAIATVKAEDITLVSADGEDVSLTVEQNNTLLTIHLNELMAYETEYTLTLENVVPKGSKGDVEPMVINFTTSDADGDSGRVDLTVDEYSNEYYKFNVKGKITAREYGQALEGVNVFVKTLRNVELGTATTDAKGNYNIDFEIDENTASGTQIFTVYSEYNSGGKKITLTYLSEADAKSIFDALAATTTAEEVDAVFTENYVKLGINYANMKKELSDILIFCTPFIGKSFADLKELTDFTNEIYAYEVLNQATSADVVKEKFEDEEFCESLGIDYKSIKAISNNYNEFTEAVAAADACQTREEYLSMLNSIIAEYLTKEYDKTDIEIVLDDISVKEGQVASISVTLAEEQTDISKIHLEASADNSNILDGADFVSADNKETVSIRGGIDTGNTLKSLSKLGTLKLVNTDDIDIFTISIKGYVEFEVADGVYITKDVNEASCAITITAQSGKTNRDTVSGGGYSAGLKNPATRATTAPIVEPTATPVPDGFYGEFNDLSGTEWAREAIEALLLREVISMNDEEMFYPARSITREEFVKMIVLAIGLDTEGKECDFVDVDNSHWAAEYIAAAKENGIVKGDDNNNFGLGNNITRQDMAVIIYRVLESMDVIDEDASANTFADDAEISDYARNAVYTLVNINMINGVGNNMFAPMSNATRAQAAQLIYGMAKQTDSYNSVSGASSAKYIGPEIAVLESYDLLPDGFNANSGGYVTKEQLAYTLSKILTESAQSPRKTSYTDVDSSSPYSGYIDFCNGNGIFADAEKFGLGTDLTYNVFEESVVKFLKYDQIYASQLGTTEDYHSIVTKLDVYDGVRTGGDSKISTAVYAKLIYNLLLAEVYDPSDIINQNGVDAGDKEMLFTIYFDLGAYEGTITDVYDNGNAEFEVKKEIIKKRNNNFTVGSTESISGNNTISLSFYKDVPVKLWVKGDNEIVHIEVKNNVEVFYDTIYSVNNDIEQNEYNVSEIRKIEFNTRKKTYDVSDDFNVEFNNGDVSYAALAKRYARIVIVNDKVAAIESWDLSCGGIITNVGNNSITYQRGDASVKINSLADYGYLKIVIEGTDSDRGQLKTGSVVSYYESDNELVLVVSDKKIVGDLNGFGEDSIITIGGLDYEYSGDVWFSENGSTFKKNANDNLMGHKVTAYFDCTEMCRFVVAGEESTTRFTAIVRALYSPDGEEDKHIMQVYKVDPVIEEGEYDLSERVSFDDGLTLNDIKTATMENIGTAVYEIELNGKNEIKSIALPDYYYYSGNEGKAVDLTFPVFEGDETKIYPAQFGNSRVYFYNDTKFVVFSDASGKIVPEQYTWTQLKAKTTDNGVMAAILSDPEASIPELVLIYGNTSTMAKYNSSTSAIVTKVISEWDEELSENVKRVTMLSVAGTKEVKMKEADAKNIKAGCYVTYSQDAFLSYSGIFVTNVMELPEDFEAWGNITNMFSKPITRVDQYRVFYEDGTAYQMQPGAAIFGVQRVEDGFVFEALDYSEVNSNYPAVTYRNGTVQIIFVDITDK